MLTNKINSKLYATLILKMVMALVLSVALLVSIILISQFVLRESLIKSFSFLEKGYEERMHKLASDIQDEIIEEGYSIDESVDLYTSIGQELQVLFGDEHSERYLLLYFMKGRNLTELIRYGTTDTGLSFRNIASSYLYEIQSGEERGYLLIDSKEGSLFISITFTIAALMSITLFFVMSLRLVKPTFSYLQEIEKSVNIMATGDLNHKVVLKGNNELTSLASEINDMGEKISEKTAYEKKMEQNQRMLITNISHDLRTPLTSIIGYVDLIEKNNTSSTQVEEYAKTVKKNAVRLEKLVEDLFLYTKLTSDDVKLNISRVNVAMVIRQMLELKSDYFSYRTSNQAIFADLDVDKFHRIIDNLFSNAEKYGISGATIDIDLKTDHENVVILIKNQTHDELQDKVDFLLDRMYVANDERGQGSSGLGLSIVKELTEKMNGTVRLAYKEHEFSVRLTFPLAQ